MKKMTSLPLLLIIFISIVVFTEMGCKNNSIIVTNLKETISGETSIEDSEQAEKIILNMWWWGETEKPGVQNWISETIKLYEESNQNIKIVALLQNLDTVQTSFRTAGAAKDPIVGPDIQFFWPGTYMMPDIWNGYLEPVENLYPQSFLDQLNIINEEKFDGKIWGIPWYAVQMPIVYNKTMFVNAGLDPDNPPVTWEEFMSTCEKLKASGVTPYGLGTKDAWYINWWLNGFGLQGFDSLGDMLEVFVRGDVDNQGIRDIFTPIIELYQKGYCNKNATSLAQYEGVELFKSRDCAMTQSVLPEWNRAMGDEEVGVMKPPIFGNGKMASTGESLGFSWQVWGISSWSLHKKEAADFIMFMLSEERMEPFFKACNSFNARKDFDPSIIETQMEKDLYSWIKENPNGGNAENFIPEKIVYEGLQPAAQLIFSNNYTIDQCIDFIQKNVDEWKAISPDQVEKFAKWSNELK